ncbi:MAG: phosphatase [Bacilli bacterium]|nr:phosphatase [Bacilli bacterium]
MLYGIVDFGSNTVRMNVYRCENEEAVLLFSKKRTVGLIAYVKKRVLSEEGIAKACAIIRSFKWELDCLNIKEYNIFSTASLRNLENREVVLKQIKKETGIAIEVLSGEKEANLSFLGATNNLQERNGILIDVGGGSSEIVLFKNKKVVDAYSMPIGSLQLYEQYIAEILPDKEEKKKIVKKIEEELDKLNMNRELKLPFMCAVGGSIRAVEKVLEELQIQRKGSPLINVNLLASLEEELMGNDKKTYHKILRVKPDRIHTLVPGLLIVKTIAAYFNVSFIQVSSYGVREGYLYAKILNLGNNYE